MARNISIIIILFFVSISITYSQEQPIQTDKGQPREESAKKTTSCNIETNGNHDNSNTFSSLGAIIISTNKEAISKKTTSDSRHNCDSNHNPQKGWAFWTKDPIAVFTAGLIFCNVLFFVIQILLWLTTKKAANAAMKSAESLPRIERAYLFIEVIEWSSGKQFSSLDEAIGVPVRIQIINLGRTPAIFKDVNTSVFVKDAIPPVKWSANNHSPLIPPKDSVVIKSDGRHSIKVVNSIPRQKLTEMNIKAMCFYCCGEIRYKDIFDTTHSKKFCYKWTPSGKSTNRFRICEDSNIDKQA